MEIAVFCFPIVCKDPANMNRLKDIFDSKGIEHRPIVSGNLLRHPAFNKYGIYTQKEKLNVETLHTSGVYVGNNHFVTQDQMKVLSDILDNI